LEEQNKTQIIIIITECLPGKKKYARKQDHLRKKKIRHGWILFPENDEKSRDKKHTFDT